MIKCKCENDFTCVAGYAYPSGAHDVTLSVWWGSL